MSLPKCPACETLDAKVKNLKPVPHSICEREDCTRRRNSLSLQSLSQPRREIPLPTAEIAPASVVRAIPVSFQKARGTPLASVELTSPIVPARALDDAAESSATDETAKSKLSSSSLPEWDYETAECKSLHEEGNLEAELARTHLSQGHVATAMLHRDHLHRIISRAEAVITAHRRSDGGEVRETSLPSNNTPLRQWRLKNRTAAQKQASINNLVKCRPTNEVRSYEVSALCVRFDSATDFMYKDRPLPRSQHERRGFNVICSYECPDAHPDALPKDCDRAEFRHATSYQRLDLNSGSVTWQEAFRIGAVFSFDCVLRVRVFLDTTTPFLSLGKTKKMGTADVSLRDLFLQGALDHEVTLHIPIATSPSSSETTPEYSCNLHMSCWFATLRTASSSSSPVASPTAAPQPPLGRQRLFTCHPSWLQALCRHLHELNHLLQVHASSSSSSSSPSSPSSSSAACDDSKEDSKPLVEGDVPTKDSGDSALGSADSHEDEQKEEHREVVAEDHQAESNDAQVEATVPPLPPQPPSLWRDGDEDEDFYAVV